MPWETNKFTTEDFKPSSTAYTKNNGGVIQSVGLNRVAPELIRGARISYFGDSFTASFMNAARMRQWKPDRWGGVGLGPNQVHNIRGGVNSDIFDGDSLDVHISASTSTSTLAPWWPAAKVYTFTGNPANYASASGDQQAAMYAQWIQQIKVISDARAADHGPILDYMFNTSGISGSVATSNQWAGGRHQISLGGSAENAIGNKFTFVTTEETSMPIWQMKMSGLGYAHGGDLSEDVKYGHCWNFPDNDKANVANYNKQPRPWEDWNTDTNQGQDGTDNISGVKPVVQGQFNRGPYVLCTFTNTADETHSNPEEVDAEHIRGSINPANFIVNEQDSSITCCHMKIERHDGKKGCVYSSHGDGGKTAAQFAAVDDVFFKFVLNDYDNTEVAFVQFGHNDFNGGTTGDNYIDSLRDVYNKIMSNTNKPDKIKVVFVLGNETTVTNSDTVYTDAATKIGEFVKEYENTAFINVFGMVKAAHGSIGVTSGFTNAARENASARFFEETGSPFIHPYNEDSTNATNGFPVDNSLDETAANFGADRCARLEWNEIALIGNANNGEDPWRYSGIIETSNSTAYYVQNLGTCSYILQGSLDKENFIDIHSVTDAATVQTSATSYPYLRLKVKAKNVLDGYDPQIVLSQYVD